MGTPYSVAAASNSASREPARASTFVPGPAMPVTMAAQKTIKTNNL
ncbi:MAG: hypothetical protein WKF67_03830 [Rubrobacteraceae bacterium]